MLKNGFIIMFACRDMKVNNVKFKDTVSVIFGSNIS